MQRPSQGILGDPQLCGDLQDLLEQGQRPARVRIAEVLGRGGEEGLQQMLLVLVQRLGTSSTGTVLKRCGVVVLGVGLDPDVDGLPGHAEHAGDVGGGATIVEFQDGERPAEQAGVVRLRELTPESPPLPGRQVESAHGRVLHHSGCPWANGVSNSFCQVA